MNVRKIKDKKGNTMKIITICGDPVKQESEITYIAEQMTCHGEYCVLTPVVPFVKRPGALGTTPNDVIHLNNAHRKKIDLSEAILAMDVNGTIDPILENWIKYAQNVHKQVLYYSREIHNYR